MRSPESLDPPSGEGRGACVRMCLREKSPEHRLQPKLCASGWFLSLVLYSLPPTASEAGAGAQQDMPPSQEAEPRLCGWDQFWKLTFSPSGKLPGVLPLTLY